MPSLNSIWVHGSSVQVEDPDTIQSVVRYGWGSTFGGVSEAFAWFHISVPVPVLINDERARVEKVFVLFSADNASVRNVHVYDGLYKIREFDGLNGGQGITGDQSGIVTLLNTWVLDPPAQLNFGLGISVGVQFNPGLDTQTISMPQITFNTAGAEYQIHGLTIPTGIHGIVK